MDTMVILQMGGISFFILDMIVYTFFVFFISLFSLSLYIFLRFRYIEVKIKIKCVLINTDIFCMLLFFNHSQFFECILIGFINRLILCVFESNKRILFIFTLYYETLTPHQTVSLLTTSKLTLK